jgi:hypothetical protein
MCELQKEAMSRNDEMPERRVTDRRETGAQFAADSHLRTVHAQQAIIAAKQGEIAALTDEVEHLAAKVASAQAVPVAGSVLTDAEITEVARMAHAEGHLSWFGFDKDDDGKYTIPALRKCDFELVRAVLNSIASTHPVGEDFLSALNETFPMPDSSHASVVQHAMDNRAAFQKGWGQCLKSVPQRATPTSAPSVHVGDSRFERWFAEKQMAGVGTKQLCRDAYAAGIGDPLAAPQPVAAAQAVPGERYRALNEAWQICIEQANRARSSSGSARAMACADAIHKLAASPSPAAPKDAQGAVPVRWQMVPKEPTWEMTRPAFSFSLYEVECECGQKHQGGLSHNKAAWLYREMLLAAPQPTDTTKGA